jgi:hypothetical protein
VRTNDGEQSKKEGRGERETHKRLLYGRCPPKLEGIRREGVEKIRHQFDRSTK